MSVTGQSESHFAFGENWQSFVETVNDESIAQAMQSLQRLVPAAEIKGRRFLDIGCGSGLSMLAAARLGARAVHGVDIDPRSVAATQALLSRHMPGAQWSARLASVFDLVPERDGTFDIVHSWGVLHHTGDMWGAVQRAAGLVAPDGVFALALYRKTPLCGFWTIEKRLYSGAGAPLQAIIRSGYKAAYWLGLLATGRNPVSYIRSYRRDRGMEWHHDVHDWLGGYPYQSASPAEIAQFLQSIDFRVIRTLQHDAAAKGLFGTHCDEYVATREGRMPRLAPESVEGLVEDLVEVEAPPTSIAEQADNAAELPKRSSP
jgi:SAM-dependent methyltransferase